MPSPEKPISTSFSTCSSTRSLASTCLLVLGILLIAANLRAPITGVGPLLDQITAAFMLSETLAGMITTLPLIAFAIASPIAAMIAKRFGLEFSLFIAILLIGIGCASRMIEQSNWLFIGTGIIGVGIAFGNVLLPSLVKRDFPTKVALITCSYVLIMGLVSGGYASLSFPISQYNDLGWSAALASFSLLTIVTLVVWLPQLRSKTKPTIEVLECDQQSRIWQFPLAWQITLFLGLNSFLTYIIVGWLPSILVDAGYSPEKAGMIHGVFQVAAALPGIILIPLMSRLKDQRYLAFTLAMLAASASLGLLYAPQFALYWTMMVGFCSGGCFILGLSFISLRTDDQHQAASLSGMSQCFGYSLAAIGPMLAGYAFSLSGHWAAALWLCAGASIIGAMFGLGCGRNTTLQTSLKKDLFN
ncbi:MFS transporter [Shewanella sp. TC10]|uniref:MFS transporter n=1 Tax=Shewanella sp. TC10 TaxID=1419739 RepID=UPI00129EFA21|nr:MFS transporter [Shewanella sp. TC10]